MSYKVVRNGGIVVACGPDDDNYQPALKQGDVLGIEQTRPELDAQAFEKPETEIEQLIKTLVAKGVITNSDASKIKGDKP
jgi:hypothetical protein